MHELDLLAQVLDLNMEDLRETFECSKVWRITSTTMQALSEGY